MLIALIVMMTGGVATWIQVPPLWKQKKWREIFFFSFTLLFAIVLAICKGLRLPVPSPLNGFAAIMRPFSEWLIHLFD